MKKGRKAYVGKNGNRENWGKNVSTSPVAHGPRWGSAVGWRVPVHLWPEAFEVQVVAEAIYVVNPDSYLGSSTRKEIEYAEAQGKEIQYMESIGW